MAAQKHQEATTVPVGAEGRLLLLQQLSGVVEGKLLSEARVTTQPLCAVLQSC